MVRKGELSERGLARDAGMSQPHPHDVLKGKMQTADIITRELGLKVFDLIDESENAERDVNRRDILLIVKSRDGVPTPPDGRMTRLAARIEALAAKDDEGQRMSREIGEIRASAAAEIYAICANFVEELNRILPRPEVMIDPPEFGKKHFTDFESSLIQINIRGRILQIEFGASETLISTEEFRIPYTLAGSVRAFNQELLEKDLIEEQLIFYTIEKHRRMWRYFDARTYRSGPIDQPYLISVIEELL